MYEVTMRIGGFSFSTRDSDVGPALDSAKRMIRQWISDGPFHGDQIESVEIRKIS